MPALMPRPRPAWIWPSSLGAALCLLASLLLVPSAWWQRLWPGRLPRSGDVRPAEAAAWPVIEVILAPPDVAPIDEPSSPRPEPPADADWWWSAWRESAAPVAVAIRRRPAAAAGAPTVDDLLRIPGVRPLVSAILAAPDSLVAQRIWRLEQTLELGRDDRAGLYTAIARARSYADLKSREAAMYGETTVLTVPVTR
jgi:hypothetical protein